MDNGLRLTREFIDGEDHVSVRYKVEFIEEGEVWKTQYATLSSTSCYEEMEAIRGTESKEEKNQIFEYETKADFLDAGWFEELEQIGIKAF